MPVGGLSRTVSVMAPKSPSGTPPESIRMPRRSTDAWKAPMSSDMPAESSMATPSVEGDFPTDSSRYWRVKTPLIDAPSGRLARRRVPPSMRRPWSVSSVTPRENGNSTVLPGRLFRNPSPSPRAMTSLPWAIATRMPALPIADSTTNSNPASSSRVASVMASTVGAMA